MGLQTIERENTRERERERGVWPVWPGSDPVTRDRDPSISSYSGLLTGRAWYRSEAWKPAVVSPMSSSLETDQNAGDLGSKTRDQDPFSPLLIPLDFWHTTTLNWFLTSPASFPDQPRHLKRPEYRRTITIQFRIFGASICRCRHAWEVTACTTGLTEVWTIRPKLPVVVDWSPVTVDREGQFGKLWNFGVNL